VKKLFLICLFLGTIVNAGFFDSIIDTVSNAASTTKENQTLVDAVKKKTGMNTTQIMGTLGTLMGYAGNNMKKSDYRSVTNSVPGLNSLTSTATIAPIISSLTSSEMVQSTLKGFGVDPSMIQIVVPVLVNYVSTTGGESSGNILSTALSGLLQ
jgi:hypothetical protein